MRSPADTLPRAWRSVEHRFDGAFGAAANPLRHLGTLGFLGLWLLVGSGVYLYIAIDTSVGGAYDSITALSRDQPWAGGLLRSLHRYAADAVVLLVAAHLLREWLHRHERGVRRHAWLTGLPPLPLLLTCAIGGFWLHWDQLAQYSALATAEWLDALPLLATPLARNFISGDAVSDRLFSLFVFVHLGAPLLLLFALWFHVQRLAHTAIWPPRTLALGFIAALLLLAIALPVGSHAPADLAQVPQSLRLDWLLLFVHPLAEALTPAGAWLLVGTGFALLVGLPFLPQPARAGVAEVDPANCNGCTRCFADCPYSAVTMVPHSNGKPGRQMAQVDPDLCIACGICVGACPSSTPFRSAAELVTGIDLPAAPIDGLRERVREALAARPAGSTIVVFGCDHGGAVAPLAADDVAPFSLECAGMLPPAFVEYTLRDGARGVVVSGCPAAGCEYRLGQRWTEQRLNGTRPPELRASVPRDRFETVWAGAGQRAALEQALRRLRLKTGASAHG